MKHKVLINNTLLSVGILLLAVGSLLVPLLVFLYLFLPVVTVRHAGVCGWRNTLIFSAIPAALLFIIIPLNAALIHAVYLVLAGWVFVFLYQRKMGSVRRMFFGYLGILGFFFVFLIGFQLMSGEAYVTYLVNDFKTSLTEVMKVYETAGVFSGDDLTNMGELLEQLLISYQLVMPTVFLVIPFFVAWGNIVEIERRMVKVPGTRLKPLANWTLPQSLKNIMAFMLLVILILDMSDSQAFAEIYRYTFSSLIYLVFFVMGMSFIYWGMGRRLARVSATLKFLVVVLIMVVPLAAYVTVFVGIFDQYFGLRRIIENRGGMGQ